MDTPLKHKLIEIVVDKLLIGMIILFASFLLNKSLEHYKQIDAQRVGGTTEFVKACQDIWSKVFEYETTIDQIEALNSERWLYKSLGGKDFQEKDKQIKEMAEIGVRQLGELKKMTNERKFLIGNQFVMHFWQYVGFVDMRVDLKKRARERQGEESKRASDDVQELNKRIAAMRFTAEAAREYAITNMVR